MDLYITTNSPHQWVIVNDDQRSVIAAGESQTLDELALEQPIKNIKLIAPSLNVASHHVDVPGTSRKNVINAIPFVLEEELTDDIDDLHFALQKWSPGEGADVLVVKDRLIRNSMAEFSDAGFSVNDVIPHYLLLPQHPSTDITLAKIPSGDYLIRSGDGSGSVIDEDMLELWWEMEAKGKSIAMNDESMVKEFIAAGWDNVQFWDIGDSMAQWIAHGSLEKTAVPCLLQGKYDDTGEKQTRFDYKMAVNFMLAGVGIYVLSILANYFYLGYQANQLESQAIGIYETAFPELQDQTFEDPIYEFRKAISALGSGNYQSDNFLSIFQVIANQLQSMPNTTLTNLIFEEDVLKAEVVVLDFAALDALFISLSTITQGYATIETKNAAALEDVVKGTLEVTLTQG